MVCLQRTYRLGLAEHGLKTGKTHVITSQIEHKAVLEPFAELERRGFAVTRVGADASGRIRREELAEALRPETLLVSIMQVNNETGIRQPLTEIAKLLRDHEAWFHTDAAQGLGKELEVLRNPRIDLISVSGHLEFVLPHVLNVAFGELDSEALIVALKDLIAISNGSACTSASYTPSHVLRAMGMSEEEANRCVRISWCHLTPEVDWDAVAERIRMVGS